MKTYTKLLALAGWTVVFAIAVVALVLAVQTETVPAGDPSQLDGTSYADKLIERHGCWTGDAPEGVIPSGVIALDPSRDAVAPRYYGPVVTGKALDQLFAGEDHGLTVFAFCPESK